MNMFVLCLLKKRKTKSSDERANIYKTKCINKRIVTISVNINKENTKLDRQENKKIIYSLKIR